jgi:hypothetical protein
MIDQRYPKFMAADGRRRFRRRDIGDEARRGSGPGGQLPPQQIEKTTRSCAIRIEEALPVEVLQKGRTGTVWHESTYLLTV